MKHQQVSVDYWAMVKTMVVYGVLTGLVWLMLRLFNTVFTLPRRLRAQQENMQNTLAELQRRYPDLNITEEELKQAEKEFGYLVSGENAIDGDASRDNDDNGVEETAANKSGVLTQGIEEKKTI